MRAADAGDVELVSRGAGRVECYKQTAELFSGLRNAEGLWRREQPRGYYARGGLSVALECEREERENQRTAFWPAFRKPLYRIAAPLLPNTLPLKER